VLDKAIVESWTKLSSKITISTFLMILFMSLLPLFFLVSGTWNVFSPKVNMPIGLEGGGMDTYTIERGLGIIGY